MIVLVVHNHYQQRGGEDVVFEAETALLEAQGHQVVRFTVHNDAVDGLSRAALLKKSVWNTDVHDRLQRTLRTVRPDVMHVHNTLPLLSPAVFAAARAEGIPTVLTLHNYRLLCPSALLFRDGQVCTSCVGKTLATPAIRHACYRGSRAASAAVAATTAFHWMRGTWHHDIDAFIALTEAGRQTFIQGGLPADKLHVKPNFLATDPGLGPHDGGFFLFVGRLSPEKGVHTLLAAWSQMEAPPPLKIVGDGPLADEVLAAAEHIPALEYVGRQPKDTVLQLMGAAEAVVVPSVWPEPFGLVAIEAFAKGTPVIAARIGALAELVDNRTGRLFRPNDMADLIRAVHALPQTPEARRTLHRHARAAYTSTYAASSNYKRLIDIYHAAGAAVPASRIAA